MIPASGRERFEGCLLGLALGDALGAPHEGGPIERLFWRLIGTTREGQRRWTDDAQMSIDVAESLIEQGTIDPDDLAVRFARSDRWSRGYGPGAATLLKRIAGGADWREANRSVFPQGSFGNGGAMRAPVVGLFYAARPEVLVLAAHASAHVTHAHPLGMEGAVLIATVTAQAARGHCPLAILEASSATCAAAPFVARLAVATRWLRSAAEPAAEEVARAVREKVRLARLTHPPVARLPRAAPRLPASKGQRPQARGAPAARCLGLDCRARSGLVRSSRCGS